MSRLFEALPLKLAMPELTPKAAHLDFFGMAQEAVDEVPDRPELQAAIWLYIDDLHRSHEVSQTIDSAIGAYWHGIMHRREGDFWNSKYWFRQAASIHLNIEGYEPSRFVDAVEEAHGRNHDNLVRMQRAEWQALYDLCRRAT